MLWVSRGGGGEKERGEGWGPGATAGRGRGIVLPSARASIALARQPIQSPAARTWAPTATSATASATRRSIMAASLRGRRSGGKGGEEGSAAFAPLWWLNREEKRRGRLTACGRRRGLGMPKRVWDEGGRSTRRNVAFVCV